MLFRERQLMNSFKPGDWVKYKDQQDTTIYKVINILSNGLIDIEDTIVDKYDIELWQPKVGEWCWFWNKDMDTNQSPRLAQFHLMTEELQKPMDFPAFYQTKYKATKLGYLYDFCEPFIGQLPTSLKDNS